MENAWKISAAGTDIQNNEIREPFYRRAFIILNSAAVA